MREYDVTQSYTSRTLNKKGKQTNKHKAKQKTTKQNKNNPTAPLAFRAVGGLQILIYHWI